MEVHWLRVFKNRVLRRIFGPERKEATGDWRNLHNKMALFTKYHQEIKSGMKGVGHVARMERRDIHSVLKVKSEADHLENQDVHRKIVSSSRNRTGGRRLN